MRANGATKVGRFTIDFEVANNTDIDNARNGLIRPEEIRRLTMRGAVDSGATNVPTTVVERLGLNIAGRVRVTYADGRTAERDKATGVYVEILGRSSTFSAVVEPKRETALIGAIVLEDLDFLVDAKEKCLVPRDPEMPISEIE